MPSTNTCPRPPPPQAGTDLEAPPEMLDDESSLGEEEEVEKHDGEAAAGAGGGGGEQPRILSNCNENTTNAISEVKMEDEANLNGAGGAGGAGGGEGHQPAKCTGATGTGKEGTVPSCMKGDTKCKQEEREGRDNGEGGAAATEGTVVTVKATAAPRFTVTHEKRLRSKRVRKLAHEEWCFVCVDGGELVECAHCPKVGASLFALKSTLCSP